MSTAAVINLIQRVRRQEGRPEGSGAAIPKLETNGAESAGDLSIPSLTLPKWATVTEPRVPNTCVENHHPYGSMDEMRTR